MPDRTYGVGKTQPQKLYLDWVESKFDIFFKTINSETEIPVQS